MNFWNQPIWYQITDAGRYFIETFKNEFENVDTLTNKNILVKCVIESAEINETRVFTFLIEGQYKQICRERATALKRFFSILEHHKLIENPQVFLIFKIIQVDHRDLEGDNIVYRNDELPRNRELRNNAPRLCEGRWVYRFIFKIMMEIDETNEIRAVEKLKYYLEHMEISGTFRLDIDKFFHDDFEIGTEWYDIR